MTSALKKFWTSIDAGNFLGVLDAVPALNEEEKHILARLPRPDSTRVERFMETSQNHIVDWRASHTKDEELSGFFRLQAIDWLLDNTSVQPNGGAFLKAVVRPYDYEVDKVSKEEEGLILQLLEKHLLSPSVVSPPTPVEWLNTYKTMVLEHTGAVLGWCFENHMLDFLLDGMSPSAIASTIVRPRPFDHTRNQPDYVTIKEMFANARLSNTDGVALPLDIGFSNLVGPLQTLGQFLRAKEGFTAQLCKDNPEAVCDFVGDALGDMDGAVSRVLLRHLSPHHGDDILLAKMVGRATNAQRVLAMNVNQVVEILRARPHLLTRPSAAIPAPHTTLHELLLSEDAHVYGDMGKLEAALEEIETLRQKQVLERSLGWSEALSLKRKM